MLSNFLIGTLSGILFLLMKNIFVYDLFGLELQFLRGLRPQQVTEDVQHTSRIVSGWRSMDSSREHSAYFQQDPLAAFMAGDEVVSSAEQEAVGIFRAPEANELHSVTLRQLAIDRRIQRHCSSRTEHELPAIRQVVLIGAGMDTRPYRLSLPHTHWFEIDMPEVISLKEELLANISQSHEHSTTLQVKQCTRIPFDLKDSSSSSTHFSHLKFTISVCRASSSRSRWLYSFLGRGGRGAAQTDRKAEEGCDCECEGRGRGRRR